MKGHTYPAKYPYDDEPLGYQRTLFKLDRETYEELEAIEGSYEFDCICRELTGCRDYYRGPGAWFEQWDFSLTPGGYLRATCRFGLDV